MASGNARIGTEEELDAFYRAGFPDGPQPIATFRADNPDDVARFKAAFGVEAMTKHFGPGGGLDAITAILRGEPIVEDQPNEV